MLFELLQPYSFGLVLGLCCGFLAYGIRAALNLFEDAVFPDLGDES